MVQRRPRADSEPPRVCAQFCRHLILSEKGRVEWKLTYFALRKCYPTREQYGDTLHFCRHCSILFWKVAVVGALRGPEGRVWWSQSFLCVLAAVVKNGNFRSTRRVMREMGPDTRAAAWAPGCRPAQWLWGRVPRASLAGALRPRAGGFPWSPQPEEKGDPRLGLSPQRPGCQQLPSG